MCHDGQLTNIQRRSPIACRIGDILPDVSANSGFGQINSSLFNYCQLHNRLLSAVGDEDLAGLGGAKDRSVVSVADVLAGTLPWQLPLRVKFLRNIVVAHNRIVRRQEQIEHASSDMAALIVHCDKQLQLLDDLNLQLDKLHYHAANGEAEPWSQSHPSPWDAANPGGVHRAYLPSGMASPRVWHGVSSVVGAAARRLSQERASVYGLLP